MRILTGVIAIVLLGLTPVSAGEILLTNGSQLEGELAMDVILVSTGSDLVEVLPDQVESLVPGEVHLKDGRTVHGTIIGGVLKVRTPLGEMGLKLEELRRYSAGAGTGPAPTEAVATRIPGPPEATGTISPPAPTPLAQPVATSGATVPETSVSAPPPPAAPAAVPETPAAAAPAPKETRAPGQLVLVPRSNGAVSASSVHRLRVVAPTATLRRDAYGRAEVLGTVRRGEQVTYLDSIDRRLRLPWFNTVLDGGYWIKVKTPNGLEGWVQADALEGVR